MLHGTRIHARAGRAGADGKDVGGRVATMYCHALCADSRPGHALPQVTTVMMRNLPNKYTQQMLPRAQLAALCGWNLNADMFLLLGAVFLIATPCRKVAHLRLGELRDAGFHMQEQRAVSCKGASLRARLGFLRSPQEDFDFFYLPPGPRCLGQ